MIFTLMGLLSTFRRKYHRLALVDRKDRRKLPLPLIRHDITFRLLNNNDSIDELTELIKRAYSVHQEAGLHHSTINQSKAETLKRVRHAYTFVALFDNRIIGTISYKPPWECRGTSWFKRPLVAKTNMLAIEPEFQGKGIASIFFDLAELAAYLHGAEELACDIAEKNKKQINIKEKRGYRFISYHNWKFNDYRSVIMSKSLDMPGSLNLK